MHHHHQCAELKFNCFFLMPVVDSFPLRMRAEIEGSFDHGLIDQVFDVKSVKRTLEAKHFSLMSELKQVEKIQHKFRGIHATLIHQQAAAAGGPQLSTNASEKAAASHRIKVDSSLADSIRELKTGAAESDVDAGNDDRGRMASSVHVTPIKGVGLSSLSKAVTPLHSNDTTLPMPPASATKPDQTTPLSVAARAASLMASASKAK